MEQQDGHSILDMSIDALIEEQATRLSSVKQIQKSDSQYLYTVESFSTVLTMTHDETEARNVYSHSRSPMKVLLRQVTSKREVLDTNIPYLLMDGSNQQ